MMSRGFVAVIAAAAACAVLLAGCGGGSNSPTIRALAIYPTDFTARVGDVIPFNAVATYSDGTQANVSYSVTWASLNTAVASVGTTGTFTAKAVGSAQVTATSGAVISNIVRVTVVPVPTLPTASYFPLATGSMWQYTGTEVTTGSVHSRDITITLTQSIPYQTVRDNTTWYAAMIQVSTASSPTYLYVRHDPEGLMMDETVGQPPVKMLDASLTAGTTWAAPGDPNRTFQIAATNESVTVPAATYTNCVRVVETNTNDSPATQIVVWFHQNVGIVQERVFVGSALSSEQRLVSYSPSTPFGGGSTAAHASGRGLTRGG